MWFKVAFTVMFVVVATIATRTARRASRQHGTALNQLTNEMPALIAIRAILGIVFYTALAGWLIWPNAMPWMYLQLPMAARWAAVVLLVPAIVFFAVSFRSLGVNYRGGVGLYDDHALVTSGPYRRMRHPIYAAFILLMLLVLPLSANWLLALSGVLLVSSIAVGRIPVEERELHERFGTAWELHRSRTGSLLPRLRA